MRRDGRRRGRRKRIHLLTFSKRGLGRGGGKGKTAGKKKPGDGKNS